MFGKREIARLSFRAGIGLAAIWLLAVIGFLAVGYVEGVAWAMLTAPVAGAFMLLALVLTAFDE